MRHVPSIAISTRSPKPSHKEMNHADLEYAVTASVALKIVQSFIDDTFGQRI